jgi:TolB-like protein
MSQSRPLIGIVFLLLLQSCGLNSPHLRSSDLSGSPAHLADRTAVAVDQLLGSMNPPLAMDTTILVTSFVDLNDMGTTTKLGRLVEEQTAHQLIKRGYQVPDTRLANSLEIRDEGEFILSRDPNELRLKAKGTGAGVVVTGTTASYRGTTYVNFRLIRYSDGIALSAAQLELNDRDVAR